MKILLLGNDRLLEFLKSAEDQITISTGRFTDLGDFDFIISYGYRFIIPKNIVQRYYRRIVNLHISYLPWNRGSDPNLWSFVENTPKGVSIHYIDEGIDTGDIIAQRAVTFSDNDTLKTSYEKLCVEIERLFKEVWPSIRSGNAPAIKQRWPGTYHETSDKEKIYVPNGWNTHVQSFSL